MRRDNGLPSVRIRLAALIAVALAATCGAAPAEAAAPSSSGHSSAALAAPTILVLRPVTGPMSGGTEVQIQGEDLAETSAVTFGPFPATAFSVVSETEIRAVSPPSPLTWTVSVRVSAGGLTSQPGPAFTYHANPAPPSQPQLEPSGWAPLPILPPGPATAPAPPGPFPSCFVPNLIGMRLAAARRALWRAGCELGTVSGSAKRGKARVRRQSSRAGRTLPASSPVDLVLAAPRRRGR